MNARVTTTTSRNRLPQSDLVLLALEIAVPVGVVDLLGSVMRAGPLSALSVFHIPFYDWATVICAVWALLVLNRGPFAAPLTRQSRAKE